VVFPELLFPTTATMTLPNIWLNSSGFTKKLRRFKLYPK
jgi:hypothetical protein